KALGDVLLVRRENVDREMLTPDKTLQAGCTVVDAEQHEWRIEGDRGERVGRKTVALALFVAGGNHRHARGKGADRLPEVPAVEWPGAQPRRSWHHASIRIA